MVDLDGIRDGLEKDRMTAVVPPRPKDVRIINALLAEVERLRDGIRHIKVDLDRYVDVGSEVTPADHVATYASLRIQELLDDRTE